MTAVSPIDDLILASADGEWRHVALLIARVTDACKEAGVEANGQAIAARIYALVADGKLAAQGNIRRWRAGKIRAAGVVTRASNGESDDTPVDDA